MKLDRGIFCAIAMCLVLAAAAVAFADEDKDAEKRGEIDAMAGETLEELFESSDDAKEMSDKAYGYAVFDNLKIAIGFSGGGGSGIAVSKDGEQTYMKMATGGVGFGLGAQKYQVIFFFQTEKAFRGFVDKGWQADASAQAAAGEDGANAAATFKKGVAFYQMTDKGLMASADITGTKYWKNDDLNKKGDEKETEKEKSEKEEG